MPDKKIVDDYYSKINSSDNSSDNSNVAKPKVIAKKKIIVKKPKLVLKKDINSS
jgi:hypothetical protein